LLPARKMRIELFDNEGNKYTVAFEGHVTRNKAVRLLDLVELLGGVSSGNINQGINFSNNELSKYAKVNIIIKKSYPMIWFSSKNIQYTYENEYKEPISLSTVSTYLSRMAKRGLLIRTGSSNRLKYKIASSFSTASIKSYT
jgi:hypothetical protein